MDHPASPLPASERIELLDVLRGLAVGGILLVNIAAFAHPLRMRFTGPLEPHGPAAAAFADGIRFLAEGKFYTLFSLLFGLGLWVQSSRAEARGHTATELYARRLGVLAAIGLVHGMLIWAGDILLTYALLGFLLLAVSRARPRTVLILAALLVAAPVLACGGFAGLWHVILTLGGDQLSLDTIRAQLRTELLAAYAGYGGGFGQVALQRLSEWASFLMMNLVSAPLILAMFFVGLWLGKTGIVRDPAAHRPWLWRVLVVSLVVGVPVNVGYVWALRDPMGIYDDGLAMLLGGVSSLVAGPLLCAAYASGITLAFLRPGARRLLGVFAPVGRMALSNYLLQSLVCTTLFYGYGLGLMGRTTVVHELALATALFSGQVTLSHWWLRRFQFGPAEWLWRSLTYGSRQPMRVRPPEPTAAPAA